MQVSEEVAVIINDMFTLAKNAHFEYVTPELFLYVICRNRRFVTAFGSCGGEIQRLDRDLKTYLEEYVERVDPKCEPQLSLGMVQTLETAWKSARNSGRKAVELPHVIHALYGLEESYAAYYMSLQNVEQTELLQELIAVYEEDARKGVREYDDEEEYDDLEEINDEEDSEEAEERKRKHQVWRKYAVCLNEQLDGVNPLIGRQEELERTMQILCRKDKNNPLHIGEPGVGKTAITYGLARLLEEGRVPEPLKGAKIISLDLGSLLAGTQFRGDFEKRFKKLMDSIAKEEKPIVYIDEIHNIVGAGAVNGGSFDISNMLKPYLAAGHIRFIGATTYEEYKKQFEKRKSLVRRFQNVEIKEPGTKDAIQILEGLKARYEEFHGVEYEEGVLKYAVEMSAKYVNERYLPDKAIDLIDEAGAYLRLRQGGLEDWLTQEEQRVPEELELTPGDAEGTEQAQTEAAAQEESGLTKEEASEVQVREWDLLSGKIGVKEEKTAAAEEEAELQEEQEAEMQEEPEDIYRPCVNRDLIDEILAKTCQIPKQVVESDETAALATLEQRLKSRVFGQDEAIDQVVNAVKFSRAGLLEEGKPLSSLLFVGPTGVGKTEIAKSLAEELGIHMIRFDMSEYEEKHTVAKLIGAPAGYVGYEEGGLLTEEVRKHPHAVLLLDEFEKAHADIYNIFLQVMDYATLTDNQGRKADFRNIIIIMTSNAGASKLGKPGIGFGERDMTTDVITEEVKRIFQAEFRNRLNRIVVFHGMDEQMAERVVDKKLGELQKLLTRKDVALSADAEARKLIKKKGISVEFGAREIERVIQSEVKPLLVDEILFGSLKEGGQCSLTAVDGKFSLESCHAADIGAVNTGENEE